MVKQYIAAQLIVQINIAVNLTSFSTIYLLMKIEDGDGITLVAQSEMNLFTINEVLCKWN